MLKLQLSYRFPTVAGTWKCDLLAVHIWTMLNITQKMLYTDAAAKATQITAASQTIPDYVWIMNSHIFALIFGSVSSSRAPISYIMLVTVSKRT